MRVLSEIRRIKKDRIVNHYSVIIVTLAATYAWEQTHLSVFIFVTYFFFTMKGKDTVLLSLMFFTLSIMSVAVVASIRISA